jgi:hypothetical protein
MSDWFLFVLLVLGVSRLLRLIQADKITERARELIYNRWPYDAKRGALLAEWKPETREVSFSVRRNLGIEDVRPTRLAYLLSCPWCLGLWVSALAVAVVAQLISVPLPVLWAAALAHAVSLVARFR